MSFTGDSGTLGALADVGEADQVVGGRRAGEAVRRGAGARSGSRTCCSCRRCVIFGVFVFYPFFRNFYLGFYQTPPFPGLPKRYVGFDQYRDVLTSHGLRRQPQDDGRLRAPHRADRHRARPRCSRCSRTSSCAAIGDLPHDLLVDGRDVGRGRRR